MSLPKSSDVASVASGDSGAGHVAEVLLRLPVGVVGVLVLLGGDCGALVDALQSRGTIGDGGVQHDGVRVGGRVGRVVASAAGGVTAWAALGGGASQPGR